jgi:hypothetical protein
MYRPGRSEKISCGTWSFSAQILGFRDLVASKFLPVIEREPSRFLPKEIARVHRMEWTAVSWVAAFQAAEEVEKGMDSEVAGTSLRSKSLVSR